MTTTAQTLELKFAPVPNGHGADWPELKDASGRIPDRDLAGMARELNTYYGFRDYSTPGNITFKKTPHGLPREWKLIPEPNEARGCFVRLIPLNAESEPTVAAVPLKSETTTQQPLNSGTAETALNPMPSSPSIGKAEPPKRPETQPAKTPDPAGHTTTTASKSGTGEGRLDGVASVTDALPVTLQKDESIAAMTSEPVQNSPTHPIEQNGVRWQTEFFADVGQMLESNSQDATMRPSDSVVLAEVLESAVKFAERNPQQFTLVLYQALVRLMYQVAASNHRVEDVPRLDIVLLLLDRMCLAEFNAELDRRHAARTTATHSSAIRELPWTQRLLELFLERA